MNQGPERPLGWAGGDVDTAVPKPVPKGMGAKHTGQRLPGPRPRTVPACVALVSPSLQWAPDGMRSWAPGTLHPTPAHPGPAACCRPGRWTRTPPAGGRPGAAATPASPQTPSAGTPAAGKARKVNPGPQSSPTPTAPSFTTMGPQPLGKAVEVGRGAFLRPGSECRSGLSSPMQEPLAKHGQSTDMGDKCKCTPISNTSYPLPKKSPKNTRMLNTSVIFHLNYRLR